jgi:hypothetical protein
MKDSNFYQVAGWMINRLNLRGNELICYAVIYSFSQDEESMYMGGVKYLQSWMNASEPTVLGVLDKLVGKGLIHKETAITELGKRCYYRVTKESLVGGTKESLVGGTKESLVNNNNNNNNNIDNKKRENNKLSSPKKGFVKPTIEEVDAYIKEKGYHFDAEQFWNHYESVGWMIGKNHMKDWHCACATWEGRRKREIKEKEDSEPSDARAPMDVEQWERNQRWMEENTPKYVGKISFDDFISMRGEVMLNSRIYGEILKEMHQSGYEGDIVAEFKRRNDERICSHG